ncbi:hypothetical protein J6590_039687 [Homalodisca vitripennis]|nr:hypothetical protein J6590_039687 [Homalodisca vitripennis]
MSSLPVLSLPHQLKNYAFNLLLVLPSHPTYMVSVEDTHPVNELSQMIVPPVMPLGQPLWKEKAKQACSSYAPAWWPIYFDACPLSRSLLPGMQISGISLEVP